MLIVGSKALTYHFPNLERNVKDVDVIGDSNDINYLINSLSPERVIQTKYLTTLVNIKNPTEFFNTPNVEVLNSDESVSLKEYVRYEVQNGKIGNGLMYASPEVLLSLKCSHINFPVKFEKLKSMV
jgi:hypothetical protein